MIRNNFFSGMIYDENNHPVQTARIGSESVYVVNDDGFMRHIDSEYVDRQIFKIFTDSISGNEDYLANQAGQMTGKTDLFSIAILKDQFKNVDKALEEVFQLGLPEDALNVLAMSGFRVNIDCHGDIVNIRLPNAETDD